MKRPSCFIPLIFLFLILLNACTKEEVFPIEPAISFISLTKKASSSAIDDKGILKIFFTDGDGDLGLDTYDTLAPFDKSSVYYYNYFIKLFEKQHKTWVEVNTPMVLNARIPRLNSSGNSKSIKGEIELEVYINNYTSPYDTIRFEASICDRALHISNVITTPELVIKKH